MTFRFRPFFQKIAVIGVSVGLCSGFTLTASRSAGSAPPKVETKIAPAVPASSRTTPVGFPQDIGPHDASAAIEWWYFNSFLTTQHGHHYAVIGAFFRTGLSPTSKGHYLIYALADLDAKTQESFALIDHAEIDLLKAYMSFASATHPNDPRPLQMLTTLQRGEFPPPLRATEENAKIVTKPAFSFTMDNVSIAQESPDGRSWKANLNGDDWNLDLTLEQPADRPPMLVGGAGRTGLKRPDDMYYLSLTRMKARGTLTYGGVVDTVSGTGWLDRQWGTSWILQNNGWDWFGLQLSDGSDLIVYRIRDNATGKIFRSDATLLSKNGIQTVEVSPSLTPGEPAAAPALPGTASLPAAAPKVATYVEPTTHIAYPQTWTITLPKLGLTLTAKSAFPEQTMSIFGIGDAIWEGVVNVTGTRNDIPLTGQGYMELVGYKPQVAPAPDKESPTVP